MYNIREMLRYRLASLIIEAIESGRKCDIKTLDKYEAIIYQELKPYLAVRC